MLTRANFIEKNDKRRSIALPFFWVEESGSSKPHSRILTSTNNIHLAFEMGSLFFNKPCAIAIYDDGFIDNYHIEHFNKYIEHFNNCGVLQGYITSLDVPAVEYKTRIEILDEIIADL